MEKEDRNLVGICGIYCGACPSYLAPRQNDIAELEKRAREKNFTLEEARCDGCHSDNVMPTCVVCQAGFRKCASEHGVTWCFECTDFSCQRLEDFKNVHIVDGISHHEHLIEELQYLKDNGVEVWLEKVDRENRCPQCGKRLYWHTRDCPDCQAHIR
jgi:hypothetical protein